MIHTVSGEIAEKGDGFVVLDVVGIGIKLLSHQRALDRLPQRGSRAKLYSYLHVRDDGVELYGFPDEEELRFFTLLNSVSGVGPKSALAVLQVADLSRLGAAISEGRPDLLTRASGIGRKTAERIVLELKGKVGSDKAAAKVVLMESDADIIEALVGLGYRRDQAKETVRKVGDGILNTEARLKEALKILGGKRCA